MGEVKIKSCVDCLNCKVSAKSTRNNQLCYCAEIKHGKDTGNGIGRKKSPAGNLRVWHER
jgi:hypothetical protein